MSKKGGGKSKSTQTAMPAFTPAIDQQVVQPMAKEAGLVTSGQKSAMWADDQFEAMKQLLGQIGTFQYVNPDQNPYLKPYGEAAAAHKQRSDADALAQLASRFNVAGQNPGSSDRYAVGAGQYLADSSSAYNEQMANLYMNQYNRDAAMAMGAMGAGLQLPFQTQEQLLQLGQLGKGQAVTGSSQESSGGILGGLAALLSTAGQFSPLMAAAIKK